MATSCHQKKVLLPHVVCWFTYEFSHCLCNCLHSHRIPARITTQWFCKGQDHNGAQVICTITLNPFLLLSLTQNMEKTKELVINFRRTRPLPHTHLLYIKDIAVETVQQWKFRGFSENLTWILHTSSLVKKANQHLHFLHRLKRVHLSPVVLTSFYRGTVESASLCSMRAAASQTGRNWGGL